MDQTLLAYFLQIASVIGLHTSPIEIDVKQAYCLAKNVYHEARGEPINGQYGVAFATINRSKKAGYPDNICDVITYTAPVKGSRKKQCAFSWVCNPKKRIRVNRGSDVPKPVDEESFIEATTVAINALGGLVPDNTSGATHFFNPSLAQPSWRNRMKLTARYGNHVFYATKN